MSRATGAAPSRRTGDAGASARRGSVTACPDSQPNSPFPRRDNVTHIGPELAMDGERRIDDGRTVGAWREAPQRPTYPRHQPETTAVSGTASLEVRHVVDAVCRSIALDRSELADEFFPAHLPVALIDAVFRSRLRPGERPAPMAERYCRRFGITPRRANGWTPPPVDEQETLGDLVRHYDELGADAIASKVFRSCRRFPGAKISRAENVVRAAQALRHIGVDVLQDVPARRPAEIDTVLRTSPGIDGQTVRMLLMYAGAEDFVLGDTHVRRFVASAIGKRAVPASQAEALVRATAYELILSPRLLDHEIWLYGVSGAGVAKPPEPPSGN